jgi:hypothetical protein
MTDIISETIDKLRAVYGIAINSGEYFLAGNIERAIEALEVSASTSLLEAAQELEDKGVTMLDSPVEWLRIRAAEIHPETEEPS